MGTARVRSAVIGTGFMGRVHLEALRRLGFVDVVSIAGSHVDKAQTMADAFGVPHATGDCRAILRDRDVDVVHVCTPNVQHYPMAAAALDAGKHVICEKPLSMNSDEAADLVNRATARGLRHAHLFHKARKRPLRAVEDVCRKAAAGTRVLRQDADRHGGFDGLRHMRLLDAVRISHERRGWVDVLDRVEVGD